MLNFILAIFIYGISLIGSHGHSPFRVMSKEDLALYLIDLLFLVNSIYFFKIGKEKNKSNEHKVVEN